MKRKVEQDVRLVALLSKTSNKQIGLILQGSGEFQCDKCLLEKNCSQTIGRNCSQMISEYLNGIDW